MHHATFISEPESNSPKKSKNILKNQKRTIFKTMPKRPFKRVKHNRETLATPRNVLIDGIKIILPRGDPKLPSFSTRLTFKFEMD